MTVTWCPHVPPKQNMTQLLSRGESVIPSHSLRNNYHQPPTPRQAFQATGISREQNRQKLLCSENLQSTAKKETGK